MGSIFDVKYDLKLALRSRSLNSCAKVLQACLWSHGHRFVQQKNDFCFVQFYGKVCLLLAFFEACVWSGHLFAASARPRASTKKLAMSPSSAVHGGQYNAKHVTFE